MLEDVDRVPAEVLAALLPLSSSRRLVRALEAVPAWKFEVIPERNQCIEAHKDGLPSAPKSRPFLRLDSSASMRFCCLARTSNSSERSLPANRLCQGLSADLFLAAKEALVGRRWPRLGRP